MVRRVAKIRCKPVRTATKALPVGATLVCADNTGGRILKIISVAQYKARHRRLAKAGAGDMINCRVVEGDQKLRGVVMQAIVIRQRKEFRRPDGARLRFEDNAAVLCTEDGDMKGTEIKGPVAREAADKWPNVAAMASVVA